MVDGRYKYEVSEDCMKKSELEATIKSLQKENAELREQLILYKRSECIGDDR